MEGVGFRGAADDDRIWRSRLKIQGCDRDDFAGQIMNRHGKSDPERMIARKGRAFTIFLVVLCAGLSAEVVLLVRKTRDLEQQLARATKNAPTIQPGAAFEPFTVVDEFGTSTLIEFGEDQPETLLLVFSIECAACEEVFPLWNEVVPVEISNALRVIPIHLGSQESLSDGESYALPVSAFSIAPADLEPFGKITRVPATLLLSNKGVVEHAWSGVPTPDEANMIREAIAAYAGTSE